MAIKWIKRGTSVEPEKVTDTGGLFFGLKPIEGGVDISKMSLTETYDPGKPTPVIRDEKEAPKTKEVIELERLSTEIGSISERIKLATPKTEGIQWIKKGDATDQIKIDLLPDDAGMRIYGTGIPDQTIYRKDFDEEQEQAFQRMKDVKLLESKIDEFESLRESYEDRLKRAAAQTGLGSIPVYGAVDILGRSLGVQLGAAKSIKAQNEFLNQQIEAQNQVIGELKKAREEGDTERVGKLTNLLTMLSEDLDVLKSLVKLTEDQLADAPNQKQIIGAAAELALLAVGSYKPYYGTELTGKLGKAVKPFSASSQVTNLFKIKNTADAVYQLERYGKIAAKSGVRMALWSATGSTKLANSSTQDIIEAAEKGLKRGVIIAPALTFVGDLIGFGVEKATPHIKKGITDLESSLKEMAKGEVKETKSAFDIAMEGIKKPTTFRQRVGEAGLKTIQFFETAQQKLVDRFHSFKKIEDAIYRVKGEPLEEGEKLLRDVRMLNDWADGISAEKSTRFANELAKYSPETQMNAKAYLSLLDKIDRAELGLEVAGGRGLGELRETLGQFAVEMGNEEMSRLAEIRKFVKGFHVEQLQGLVDAGLKTSEEVDKIMLAHPNYLPHSVVLDQIERSYIDIGAETLDVPKDVLKRALGSSKDITDPFEAMINQTVHFERLKEKNILINNLYNASVKYGSQGVLDTVRILEDEKDIVKALSEGEGIVSFFRDGKKTNISVPINLANSIKGLNVPVSSKFWQAITAPQRVLKKGATEYNAAFIVNNKFRDADTAAAFTGSLIEDTAKRYGFDPANARVFSSAELKEVYSKGGWGASIFSEGADSAKKVLEKAGISKNLNYIEKLNPLKAISQVNEFVEQSTRKHALAEALMSGLSEKDALWVSRNATLDFSRMGEWMRMPNQLIPFLNANFQGLLAIPKAYLSSPERFTEAIMTTSVLPSFLLHQHNRRYESYKYISQALKDHNWIIMTGEVPAVNPHNGDPILVPQFVTIKRGEPQSAVAGPISWWLEREDGIDDRKVTEMLADTVGAISPLDFGLFSRENFFESVASSLGPVGSMMVGGAAGIDPFYGTRIVPESREGLHREMQFTERTPQIFKDIPKGFYRSGFADTFNMSPAMLDFYTSAFGGAAKDTIRALDLVYGIVREGRMGGLSVTDTPFETLTEIPVISSFLRQRVTSSTEAEREMIKEIEKDVLTDTAILNDRADEVIKNLRKLDTETQKRSYLSSLSEELSVELLQKIVERASIKESVMGLSATKSTKVRAQVIVVQVEKMKQTGKPEKEIANYLQELINAKILTEDVLKEISKITDKPLL